MLKYPKKVKLFIKTFKYLKNFRLVKINGIKYNFEIYLPFILKINKNQIFLEYDFPVILKKKMFSKFKKILNLKNIYYSILRNMIIGTFQKFKIFFKLVDMNKDGYKVYSENNNLFLKLGYSHDICYDILDNYDLKIGRKQKSFKLYNHNFFKITQFSFLIRKKRVPEPYKGKGILFKNEKILKKKIRKLRSTKNFKKKRKIKIVKK